MSRSGWPIRVCRVEDSDDDDSREFHMPVFAFVLTKFKKMPNMSQVSLSLRVASSRLSHVALRTAARGD